MKKKIPAKKTVVAEAATSKLSVRGTARGEDSAAAKFSIPIGVPRRERQERRREIMDAVEVAELLRIPWEPDKKISYAEQMTAKVYELTRKRAPHPLPFFKVGKLLRFRRSDILRWIDEASTAISA